MEYLDFEVRVATGSGRDYPVLVVRSPAGETRGTMRFPFDTLALQNQLLGLQNALLRSGSLRRQAVADPEETKGVADFGLQLFQALFTPELQVAYRRSQDRARADGKGLRLRLRIEAPELAGLPWEYMYDPSERDYLCLSTDTPLVRYLEFDQPPHAVTITPPLSLLVMVASPKDHPALDVKRERERIEVATAPLRAAGLMSITWLKGSSWRDLQHELRRGAYHVFHFVGHGGFDSAAGEGVLLFTDDQGNSSLIGATATARLLCDHPSLRLAVLNSCLGAKGSTTDAMSSTASVLVARGIPAVVAMQFEISDDAAIEFSRSLYEAIADGQPIDAAVSDARKAVSFSSPRSVEWGTPVLYMRSPDGVLFHIDGTTVSEARKTGNYPRPASLEAALAAASAPPPPSTGPAAVDEGEGEASHAVPAALPFAARIATPTAADLSDAVGVATPVRQVSPVAQSPGTRVRGLVIGAAVLLAGSVSAFLFLRPQPSGIGDVQLAATDTMRLVAGSEKLLTYTLLESDRKTAVANPAAKLQESGGRVVLLTDKPNIVAVDSAHVVPGSFALLTKEAGEARIWPVIVRLNGDTAGSKKRTIVLVTRATAKLENAVRAFNDARDAAQSDSVSDLALRAMVLRVDSTHGAILRAEGGRAEDLDQLLAASKAVADAKLYADSILADSNRTLPEKRVAYQAYLNAVESARDGHAPGIADAGAQLAALDASTVGTVAKAGLCRGSSCDDSGNQLAEAPAGSMLTVKVWYVRGSSGELSYEWRRNGIRQQLRADAVPRRVETGYRTAGSMTVRDAGSWEVRVLNGAKQLVFRHPFIVR